MDAQLTEYFGVLLLAALAVAATGGMILFSVILGKRGARNQKRADDERNAFHDFPLLVFAPLVSRRHLRSGPARMICTTSPLEAAP